MSIELNIEDGPNKTVGEKQNTQSRKTSFLSDRSVHDIARVFSNFGNRTLIIPIGFPQAGKSLFLSSIFY